MEGLACEFLFTLEIFAAGPLACTLISGECVVQVLSLNGISASIKPGRIKFVACRESLTRPDFLFKFAFQIATYKLASAPVFLALAQRRQLESLTPPGAAPSPVAQVDLARRL